VLEEAAMSDLDTLGQMIDACHFVRVGYYINTTNFPITGPVAVVADMLPLVKKDLGGRNFEIEAVIDRKGYRGASLVELLAYAKTRWNGRYLVVAPGSSWVDPDGFRRFPYLCGDGDGRELYLGSGDREYGWCNDALFLVVPKQILGACSVKP
jgi:hypothetical protein